MTFGRKDCDMKDTMTPRERVHRALNHEIPDRVPIDLGGFQSGIHRKAYQNLLAHLGIQDEKQEILDPVQQLAVPCEQLLQRLHVDTRYVRAHGPDGFDGSIKQNRRQGRLWHDLKDEFGVVWSMPDDQMLYMDISHHPLANATAADLKDYPCPNGADPSRFTGLRKWAQRLHDDTPYAISTTIGGSMYEYSWYMRGLERWFMDMIENVDYCHASLDMMLKFWKDCFTAYMDQIGDLLDVVQIGDDLAAQHGVLFSPQFYRKIVKPRQQQLIEHIKSLTSAKIWYHTCGSCVELIPDLIEVGADIINPVQISAANMKPSSLKKKFGQDIVFWGGGCDPQRVLPFATPDEVRQHVRENIQAFKQGGGYVFNNVHNIQSDVPPENIVALFDAAYEFGSMQ